MNHNFSQTDENGVYRANEPIYGFRADSPRNGLVINYIRAYQILRAISMFTNASTVLDAGGGEGYTAHLIKKLLHINKVEVSDISPIACRRARDIFHLKANPQNITHLRYPDNHYDIVVCSETLEHIPDFRRALKQLLRVAKYGVIITIPHESENLIAKSVHQGVPGDHVHAFKRHSFDYLKPQLSSLIVKTMLSPLLYLPNILVDASPRQYNQFYARQGIPPAVIQLYNFITPVFKTVFSAKMAASLVYLDDWLCRHTPWYGGIIITLVKKGTLKPPIPISVNQIMTTTVPFYYPKSN